MTDETAGDTIKIPKKQGNQIKTSIYLSEDVYKAVAAAAKTANASVSKIISTVFHEAFVHQRVFTPGDVDFSSDGGIKSISPAFLERLVKLEQDNQMLHDDISHVKQALIHTDQRIEPLEKVIRQIPGPTLDKVLALGDGVTDTPNAEEHPVIDVEHRDITTPLPVADSEPSSDADRETLVKEITEELIVVIDRSGLSRKQFGSTINPGPQVRRFRSA